MAQIGILVGSLRKGSFSKAIADYIATRLSPDNHVHFLDASELPLYNPDLDEEGPPKAWEAFRREAERMDAYVFVTPEYNRSFSAAIKNAIDVGSRPYTQNVWGGKPAAVISVSPGKIGGFGANHHLRQTLSCLNLILMARPEAYLGEIEASLDENGTVTNEGTRGFLNKIADQFLLFIARVGGTEEGGRST